MSLWFTYAFCDICKPGPYFTIPTHEEYIFLFNENASAYDHSVWKTGLPVRSAVAKPGIPHGQLSMIPGPPYFSETDRRLGAGYRGAPSREVAGVTTRSHWRDKQAAGLSRGSSAQ